MSSTRALIVVLIVVVLVSIVAFGIYPLYRKYAFEEEFFSDVPECTIADVLKPVLSRYLSDRNTHLVGTIINIVYDDSLAAYMNDNATDLATTTRDTEYVMNVLLKDANVDYIVQLIQAGHHCLREAIERVPIMSIQSYDALNSFAAGIVLCYYERINKQGPSLVDIYQIIHTIYKNAKTWVANNPGVATDAPPRVREYIQDLASQSVPTEEEFFQTVDEIVVEARTSIN